MKKWLNLDMHMYSVPQENSANRTLDEIEKGGSTENEEDSCIFNGIIIDSFNMVTIARERGRRFNGI